MGENHSARRNSLLSLRLYFVISLLPFAFAFHNRNVAVDGQFRKPLRFSAWVWPHHFEPIDFLSLAKAQRYARIVRGEVASSANFPRMPQQIRSSVSHFCSDGVDVRFAPDQFHTQPMILPSCLIPQ